MCPKKSQEDFKKAQNPGEVSVHFCRFFQIPFKKRNIFSKKRTYPLQLDKKCDIII
jgi:hypothetical protein